MPMPINTAPAQTRKEQIIEIIQNNLLSTSNASQNITQYIKDIAQTIKKQIPIIPKMFIIILLY
jgi:hypothetical protein